jgi:hypothetical protein
MAEDAASTKDKNSSSADARPARGISMHSFLAITAVLISFMPREPETIGQRECGRARLHADISGATVPQISGPEISACPFVNLP